MSVIYDSEDLRSAEIAEIYQSQSIELYSYIFLLAGVDIFHSSSHVQ